MADSTEERATQEAASDGAASDAPLRLRVWPAVLITVAMWAFLTLPNILLPESPRGFMFILPGMMGSFAMLTAWWLFASRAPWLDRILGLLVIAGGLAVGANALYDPTIVGKPFPVALLFFIIPWLITALTATMLVTSPLGWRRGRSLTLTVAVLGLVAPALLAYDGADSGFKASFRPRWQPSAEEKLLAKLGDSATGQAAPAAPLSDAPVTDGAGEPSSEAPTAAPSDWPSFRGANRDGRVLGGSLAADWNGSPPKELWRRDVGPGWSSFCVVNGFAYTQEQRGTQDCVVAYDASTGDQIWSTGVEARFEESIAGPGPRATPTYFDGDLFTTGGDGDVQRLDAMTGEVKWHRSLVDDCKRSEPPAWGYAASPLLVMLDDGRSLAIVFANNPDPDDNGGEVREAVIAYDASNGEPVWKSGVGYHSYSSPHLATLGGVEQVLSESNLGLESLDPATGERLWFYDWDIGEFPRSIQPLVVDEETVVLSAGYDSGTMLVRVTNGPEGWTTEELWDAPSQKLVPYFNDMVLYKGHLYGIHKKFLVCIDLESGEPTWPRKVKRKAQVGNGQLVLDPQSGMLLVTTEDTGEALLVEANPETLVIRSRLSTISDDRNWNHPVVAGGRLYVRHGSEAVCFELPKTEVASR